PIISMARLVLIRRLCTAALETQQQEKLKANFWHRQYSNLSSYLRRLLVDYRQAAAEALADMESAPRKTLAYLFVASLGIVAWRNNPSYGDYTNQLRQCSLQLGQLSPSVRSPRCAEFINRLCQLTDAQQLRRLNLGFVSLLWATELSSDCRLPDHTCEHLKPRWTRLRPIDVGCFSRWILLSGALRDSDVNEAEWGQLRLSPADPVISDAWD
ncbi:hypothetical protein BOX15_Mlig032364g1, partial [Macrostomum lignano]